MNQEEREGNVQRENLKLTCCLSNFRRSQTTKLETGLGRFHTNVRGTSKKAWVCGWPSNREVLKEKREELREREIVLLRKQARTKTSFGATGLGHVTTSTSTTLTGNKSWFTEAAVAVARLLATSETISTCQLPDFKSEWSRRKTEELIIWTKYFTRVKFVSLKCSWADAREPSIDRLSSSSSCAQFWVLRDLVIL